MRIEIESLRKVLCVGHVSLSQLESCIIVLFSSHGALCHPHQYHLHNVLKSDTTTVVEAEGQSTRPPTSVVTSQCSPNLRCAAPLLYVSEC